AHIEIGGADRGHYPVHDQQLVVHHRRLVLVNLHACLQQLAPMRLGSEADRFRIDVLAGHRDTYPHTTLTSGDQRLDDQLVRHEIRRLQVDGAFGCGNGHQVHEVHALAATGWRCHEHVRIHFADRRDRRKIVLAVEYLSGGLDPVVVEGGLELRHDRTLNLEVHVAPVR